MKVTCRVGDVFNRIVMAQKKRFQMTRMPKTKQTIGILDVLLNEGYINGYEIRGEEPRQEISVYLKYDPIDNQGVIKKLRLISKPSREVIVPIKQLPPCHQGLGRWILSTNKGIVSDAQARRLNVGGIVLGEVF
mmetsp:Transcript_21658/g.37295  ORF Transcript_21658/g.37295 Transcript_21658/m.37295 type:complete len:134 (-) Transcript_21658:241-642(-)